MAKRVDILGLEVDALTIDQAIDQIVRLTEQPGAHYVTKPYVEFVERAYHQPTLRRVLNGAALSLPDGVALQWAAAYSASRKGVWPLIASLFGIMTRPHSITTVLPERFAGVDTTWRLLERCERENLRVFLIGSPEGGAVDQTAAAIQRRLPGIMIVGTAAGTVDGRRGEALYQALIDGGADLAELTAVISESRADVILTGIGFPQQDTLNSILAGRLSHGVLIGEGGSFDYASFGGRRRRAPRLVRSIGLEWLWRLVLQPGRWRRQLAVPRFIWHVYREGK
jgi:N-acetylglucosaminyldiphosphoundecaprenol N-acetyl-beta-D-mannosaminyltransferase